MGSVYRTNLQVTTNNSWIISTSSIVIRGEIFYSPPLSPRSIKSQVAATPGNNVKYKQTCHIKDGSKVGTKRIKLTWSRVLVKQKVYTLIGRTPNRQCFQRLAVYFARKHFWNLVFWFRSHVNKEPKFEYSSKLCENCAQLVNWSCMLRWKVEVCASKPHHMARDIHVYRVSVLLYRLANINFSRIRLVNATFVEKG